MKLSGVEKFSVDKASIAWFKLAEFVGRKEKERALSVCRLLSHSIPDTAFAAQLEGDLFMAFHDEKALDAYLKAAVLYEKNGQLVQAALLYEQIFALRPENKDSVNQAVRLHEIMGDSAKSSALTKISNTK